MSVVIVIVPRLLPFLPVCMSRIYKAQDYQIEQVSRHGKRIVFMASDTQASIGWG